MIKNILVGVVGGIVVAIIIGIGALFWQLPGMAEKLAQNEQEIDALKKHLSELGKQVNSLDTRSAVLEERIKTPGNLPIEKQGSNKARRTPKAPLAIIDMNTAKDLHGIKVPPSFHVEWNKGPASKVFQVYKDGRPKPVFEKSIENGALVSLPSSVRGQVELKTLWDDGTREREEGVWVMVVND